MASRKQLLYQLAVVAGSSLVAASAFAQARQKPYIIVVMDTSGSTEWTPEGDEEYPTLPAAPPAVGVYRPEWLPGTPMQLGAKAAGDGDFDAIDNALRVAGPQAFGPCMVWEPDRCDRYERPPWTYRVGDWMGGFDALMNTRKGWMLGTYTGVAPKLHTGVRFDENSMPRHVMLKEILTGDMLLKANGDLRDVTALSSLYDGPGCWFVPRQRDASIQTDDSDRLYCEGRSEFEGLPDHDEPRPHFQEVFDAQVDNGVLDRLSTSALFAVAALDGYRDDVDSWDDKLNDVVDGSKIAGSAPTAASADGKSEDDGANYNLGVYRVIGPKVMDVPDSFLGQLSAHVQTSVLDAGYLRKNEYKLDFKKGFPALGLSYDKKAEKYIEKDFKFGRQPVARATPLAAAVMDVHQFLKEDDRFEPGTGGGKDPYGDCRHKEVVILTDGYPEPEAGAGIGSEALTEAFGYDPDFYPYNETETEIGDLVAGVPAGTDGDYAARVHVVALSVASDPAVKAAVVTKLSRMAKAGNTCASYYLGPEFIPISDVANSGACPPGNPCLVGGQESYAWPDPDADDGSTINCPYPALILEKNDRAAIERGVFAIMSGIIGEGQLISTTRPAISNFLDDADDFSAGGQYRVYSGSTTTGSYWRGILTREVIPCTDSGTLNFDAADSISTAGIDDTFLNSALAARKLHEDVGWQVNCGVAATGGCDTVPPTDNRRIFTSVPASTIYDWNLGAPSTPGAGGTFAFTWAMQSVNGTTEEEFRETTLPGATNPAFLLGTRIPLRADMLNKAITESAKGDIATWNDANTTTYLNLLDIADLGNIVNVFRGRIPEKGTNIAGSMKVFSGIRNADPVVVPPPILDLPVESYRSFRAYYGDRPTMLYTATLDGMLHALHIGDLKGRIKIRQQTSNNTWAEFEDVNVGAEVSDTHVGQREAWAYFPNMMLRRMADNRNSQPMFIDGATTVKDVRLCQADPAQNQSVHACDVANATGALLPEQQWRTVLVQALGEVGSGYFALDVTRTGGLLPGAATRTVEGPDPLPLWEFDRQWEYSQVKALYGGSDEALVAPPSTIKSQWDDANCANTDDFWRSAALGLSISAPEIATIAVSVKDGATTTVQQRPVAVFAAGSRDIESTSCGAMNSALYVVDMQTGAMLRRFVHYKKADGTLETFAKPGSFARFGSVQLTGSPALFDSATGSLATRGFVGDSVGRLYRMDFRDPDPKNWKMDLFFDPYADNDLQDAADAAVSIGDANFGPAAFKPAISRGPNRQLVVTYGLGETGSLTSGETAQAVITLAEDESTPSLNAQLRWYQVFEKGEKLTGSPIVFDQVAYFPTYHLPDADACAPGRARVWGANYFENDGSEGPVGVWDPADPEFKDNGDIELTPGATSADPGLWYSPIVPTIIRGLTLTLGPVCAVRDLNTDGASSDVTAGADTQPQLIAQTSAPSGIGDKFAGNSADSERVGRITKNIKRPRSMTVPLSWSVIQ